MFKALPHENGAGLFLYLLFICKTLFDVYVKEHRIAL